MVAPNGRRGGEMDDVREPFVFVDHDRTFTCEIASLRHAVGERWWWFRVSTESDQRHAPFRAASSDTRADVQKRVVAYYDHLLARRAEPAQRRWQRNPPPPAAPVAGESAPAPESAPSPAP